MAMNVLDAHLVNTPKQTRVVARANRVFLVKKDWVARAKTPVLVHFARVVGSKKKALWV
jgi:hypothetical protein